MTGLGAETIGDAAVIGSATSSTDGESTTKADAIGSARALSGESMGLAVGENSDETPGEAAGADEAGTDPATAAAYRIGGREAFAEGVGTAGTGGMLSLFPTILIGSAFVLSMVDFRDSCFLPCIGLGGSSSPGVVAALTAGVDFLSLSSSLAGVLGGAGDANVSLISATEESSRFELSSLCA